MNGAPLYNIHHINLANPVSQFLTNEKDGKYYVFWFNDIALGHLFVEPGQKLSQQQLHFKISEQIAPTLQFYSDKTEAFDWKGWLKNNPVEEWQQKINNVFKTQLHVSFPYKVPVSIVICTRNRAKLLETCLTGLQNLSCIAEEIIVVDNNPDDNSSQEVVEKFTNVTYVRESRKGLDIARNTGLLKSTKPIVAYTDDDVVVHPLWLHHIWETFKNEDVGAMTGLVIASSLDTEAQAIFEKHWSFNRGYIDKFYDNKFFEATLQKGPPVWEIGAGANMAFRRSAFDSAGIFDELLDVGAAGCNGDSEMWFRILKHGYTIHYNPRAIVFHEHRKDIKGLKHQIFYYMRGYAAAALTQQNLQLDSGYKNHIYNVFPKYYFNHVWRGFPFYKGRRKTVFQEIRGVISGLLFYHNTKK